MKSCDVGVLPVEKSDEIVGVITDRDIVLRVLAQKMDPQKTTIDKVMTSDVVTCNKDDDIREAARLMEDKQIRRLIVLDRSDSMSGILSVSDFAVKGKDEHLSYEVLEKVCEPAHAAGNMHINKKAIKTKIVSDDIAKPRRLRKPFKEFPCFVYRQEDILF